MVVGRPSARDTRGRRLITHRLGGSVASSLVGEPRSTVDIDIALELSKDDLAHLVVIGDQSLEVIAQIEGGNETNRVERPPPCDRCPDRLMMLSVVEVIATFAWQCAGSR